MGYKDNISSILEGLSDMRVESIDEGSSVFSSKLNSFLKGVPQEDVKYIKSVINSVYLGLAKDFGGYIEGKRAIVKKGVGYRTMTWKMQTNKSTGYNFYNLLDGYFAKAVKDKGHNVSIDGHSYYGVFQDNKDEDFWNNHSNKWIEVDKQIIVGVESVYSPGQKVDRSAEGDTFKFIVSIPDNTGVKFENPDVTKEGSNYYFNAKHYTLRYDAGRRNFTYRDDGQWGLDQYCIIYKSGAGAEKAFKILQRVFNRDMKFDEVEKILRDNKVRISTSFYPGLD